MSPRPILLATDGSPSAAEATLTAIDLARALDAPLVVISVDHAVPFLGAGGFYGYAEVLAELKTIEHERIEEALEHACSAAVEAGVECEAVHADNAVPVPDQICRLAKARKVHMIVIGSHGWNPVRRVLHGSVSTAVVHEAQCPVLVVPSGLLDERAVKPLESIRARETVG